MKKKTRIALILFATICLSSQSNAQNGGGHAIKIVEWKVDNRPYPVKVFNEFIDWLYGKK